MIVGGQISLFGYEEPACDETFRNVERTELANGAWIELACGWLAGDSSLFESLRVGVDWQTESRTMYDREVAVPRLHAVLDGRTPHPLVERMRVVLSARYQTSFTRTSAALYRDGRDSVAWHGDYPARKMQTDTIVATVSLGAARTFLVRRKSGGQSLAWRLGGGDLCVMGGSCQRTYEHAIPKVASAAPRIALVYRPVW